MGWFTELCQNNNLKVESLSNKKNRVIKRLRGF